MKKTLLLSLIAAGVFSAGAVFASDADDSEGSTYSDSYGSPAASPPASPPSMTPVVQQPSSVPPANPSPAGASVAPASVAVTPAPTPTVAAETETKIVSCVHLLSNQITNCTEQVQIRRSERLMTTCIEQQINMYKTCLRDRD